MQSALSSSVHFENLLNFFPFSVKDLDLICRAKNTIALTLSLKLLCQKLKISDCYPLRYSTQLRLDDYLLLETKRGPSSLWFIFLFSHHSLLFSCKLPYLLLKFIYIVSLKIKEDAPRLGGIISGNVLFNLPSGRWFHRFTWFVWIMGINYI